jgi:hypothetical protein
MAQIYFDTLTITAGATAVTIRSLLTAGSFGGTAQGCSLWFQGDKDIYVGNSSSVTDVSGGGLLAATTPFTDSGTGQGGNVVDPNLFYVYAPLAGGDVALTIFFRSN